MNFDVYFPFRSKQGTVCPGVVAHPKSFEEIHLLTGQQQVKDAVYEFRKGNADAKKQLPAVCWVGRSKTSRRKASDMEPTQFVMVDIDHCDDPQGAFRELWPKMQPLREAGEDFLVLAHITPSGKGLRLIFRAMTEEKTLVEHMNRLNELLEFGKYGDFDTAVKDYSRLSFLCVWDEILFADNKTLKENGEGLPAPLVNSMAAAPTTDNKTENGEAAPAEPILTGDNSLPHLSHEEEEKLDHAMYRGFELKVIVQKYLEHFGEPGAGERHNYYNEMVKNFRCICDNDKRVLLRVLPRFGHTEEECWSQIVSICRVNTLSRLPKPFYFFLKDNGFYQPRTNTVDDLRDYMLNEDESKVVMPPYLPPVFRELVGTAPKDFILPCVNALLPILGTLTSYLKAKYPYDGRDHTTSFFSIIYAPPGTGKGFVERFIDLLFADLRIRDYVQSERENVFLRTIQRKGANDKAPDMPHVSLRLIPPKNSEAEFLQKQRDNHGYHMFTYAAEMDSWAKGVRAAGGNKDDMIRIAWDNGEYGQQFKSANTFKGTVNLYWNVLITGTIAQVENYFKNVENGLVTRCSFTSIDNQEFSLPPVWKSISKRGMETIQNFLRRCDLNTYETPCNIMPDDLLGIADDDFDKEVDWRFKFRERKEVDMDWIMPTINAFHKEQMELAARDVDRARDVFRRRVGVRGFRLALICYALWDKPRESDLKKCIPFVDWWMHRDLECILNLWGAKYNEQTDTVVRIVQRTVFDALAEDFTKSDVYNVCIKQGIKTPVRRILFDWKKLGYVSQVDKEHFKKNKNGK